MASAFELRPGVIVDPERGEGYLMSPQRGMDAIDLSSGKVLWSTSAAAKPLAVYDERLVAQAEPSGNAHALPIVVLDAKRAGQTVMKTEVPLPSGAMSGIDQGLDTTFAASARVGQGVGLVWWSFSQRTVSGVARPGPVPERNENGAARIDLKTGHVETLTPEQALREQRGASSPGKPADIKPDPGFSVAYPSADGRLLLTRKAIGADGGGWESYLWRIYSLKSGKRVAEIRMPTSAAPFFIWQSILFYESRPYGRRVNDKWLEEPLELRAIDIKSGAEVWKRALRDMTYRGPMPPRP